MLCVWSKQAGVTVSIARNERNRTYVIRLVKFPPLTRLLLLKFEIVKACVNKVFDTLEAVNIELRMTFWVSNQVPNNGMLVKTDLNLMHLLINIVEAPCRILDWADPVPKLKSVLAE